MSRPMPEPTLPETLAETIVERSSGDDDWGPGRLPGALDERFTVLDELDQVGGQTRGAYKVRDQDGDEWFLKLYRGMPEGLAEVWAALEKTTDPHIIKPVEVDEAAGHAYEITEFVTEGNMDDLLRRRGGLDTSRVKQVVEQVVGALKELHELGIRHRDIKPGNILVRTLDPLRIALTDFGVSRRTVNAVTYTKSDSGTPRYMAPEAPNAVSPDGDYWGLGMTVAELALGEPLLPFQDKQVLMHHIRTKPIDLSSVEDPDLRRLCQGLLVRNADHRWGAEEVRAWLDGKPPPVDDEAASGVPEARPLRFGEIDHVTPDSLAAALSRNWETGVQWTLSHLPELVTWLEQFPELSQRGELGPTDFVRLLQRSGDPPDVRHLQLLRWLNPFGKPYYRGIRITAADLGKIAARAASDDPGVAREIVSDLWRHRLLDDLDKAPQGSGLMAFDTQWRRISARWEAQARRLDAEPDVSRALREIDPMVIHAGLLMLACTGEEHREGLRAEGRRVAAQLARHRTPVPWYTDLIASTRDVASLAVVLLGPTAITRSATMIEEWRRYAEERRMRAWEEWFDRNQRTTALGWAALAVLVIAVGWIVIMTVSDLIPSAPPQAIAWAWVCSALSVLIIASTEVMSATWIGADYHPEFSLAADLIDMGGFLAHPLRSNRWVALAVITAGTAVLGAAMAFVPLVLPVVVTAVHLGRLRTRADRRRQFQRQRHEDRRSSQPQRRDV